MASHNEGIEGLVAKIHPNALRDAIGSAFLDKLSSLIGKTEDTPEQTNEWLARCTLSIYGHKILAQKPIRKGLLNLLSDGELNKIARKHTGKAFPKRDDNALAITSLGWKVGSGIVEELTNIFSLPYEYLPRKKEVIPSLVDVEPFKVSPPLHPYQKDVKDQIVSALKREPATLLLQMPTGSGKTRTAFEAIVEYITNQQDYRKLIWLAHAEELCEQALEALVKVWQNTGNRSLRIVRLWGSHDPSSAALREGAVIASIQKIYSLIKKEDQRVQGMAKFSGVIVVDEAHKLMAKSYKLVIDRLRKTGNLSLLGLTATPGRGVSAEKENIELARLFGKNIVTPFHGGEQIALLQKQRILAKLDRKTIDSEVDVSLSTTDKGNAEQGFDLGASLLSKLASNTKRNKLIIDLIAYEVNAKRPVVVFACSREHAALLAAALNMRKLPAGYIDCDMDRDMRSDVIRHYKSGKMDALLNYGVLTTGFDAPRTRTVIIARPTASVVLYGQMIGRALRGPLMGGGEESRLIDVRDNFKNFGGVDDVYSYFNEYWQKKPY